MHTDAVNAYIHPTDGARGIIFALSVCPCVRLASVRGPTRASERRHSPNGLPSTSSLKNMSYIKIEICSKNPAGLFSMRTQIQYQYPHLGFGNDTKYWSNLRTVHTAHGFARSVDSPNKKMNLVICRSILGFCYYRPRKRTRYCNRSCPSAGLSTLSIFWTVDFCMFVDHHQSSLGLKVKVIGHGLALARMVSGRSDLRRWRRAVFSSFFFIS